MAGIVFPNIMASIGPLMQMDQQRERDERESTLRAQDRADNLAFRKDEAAYRRESLDEQRAMRIQSHLAKLDDNAKAKLKDFATFRAQAGGAVLSAPPEQQEQAYGMLLQDAKARGYDMSLFPQKWDQSTAARLKFDVDQAIPIAEQLNRPQPMGPVGGAPAPGGGGTPSPNRDHFVQMMMPHALEVSKATGLDPRLVIAQAALETGFGSAAPGNNYFGIKSHNQPGGQTLATNEAGPGGAMVPTRASFRTYADPGASAKDYAEFLKTNSRYAPVLGAQGLDAQIDAMGASGYATDPQYAAKLRQIAQGLPAGPQVAQAGGAPVIPQGDAVAGQGDVMAPPRADDPMAALRTMQLPPGVRFVGKNNVPMIQGDRVLIQLPDNTRQWVPMPAKKEPGTGGPLAGTGMDQQMMNILLTGDPASQQYAAAYAYMSKPRPVFDATTGQTVVVQPMDMSVFSQPGFGRGGQPTGPAPLPPGAQQAQIPGGGTVTTLPGKGRPLDNSARDDLTKASGGVLELTELVKSFDPSFGGYMFDKAGEAANFAKRNLPDAIGGADPKGQAQWWQRYDMFANLERNKLFGSALTPGETAAFKAAMVSPGMKPEQIKANLERQQEIASKALSRIANSMKAGGYNQEAIEAATGIRMGDMPDPIGSVPQGPPPGSPADKGKQGFELRKKYGLE